MRHLTCMRHWMHGCTNAPAHGSLHSDWRALFSAPPQFSVQVTGKKFVPLAEAPNEVKRMNGGKSELHMQVEMHRAGWGHV